MGASETHRVVVMWKGEQERKHSKGTACAKAQRQNFVVVLQEVPFR